MPKYDYKCETCETINELSHSMQDTGPFLCEECGEPMRKTLTPAPVHFKGVGFYTNDQNGPFIWGGSNE